MSASIRGMNRDSNTWQYFYGARVLVMEDNDDVVRMNMKSLHNTMGTLSVIPFSTIVHDLCEDWSLLPGDLVLV